MCLPTISKSQSATLEETPVVKRTPRSSWFHASGFHCCGAMLGLGGGAVLPIIGAVLLVINRFADSRDLHLIGSFLLISTIPLLVFGAHCLDMLEKEQSNK